MSKKASEARKNRRAKSWAAGEQRKAAHREAQQDRQRANITRRKEGELTLWEKATATRLARREAARQGTPGRAS